MKRGIIAVSLLLSGALLITPIKTSASSIENNIDQIISEQVNNTNEIKATETIQSNEQQDVDSEITYKSEENNNKSVINEVTEENTDIYNETIVNEIDESGMTKDEAEIILNRYLSESEQSEVTYTYQGDENTFESIKEKGIRGYVFLPNVDTDLAFLVDKDSGQIYNFHPSGYFNLIK